MALLTKHTLNLALYLALLTKHMLYLALITKHSCILALLTKNVALLTMHTLYSIWHC
jgi:hypothetical protein